MLDSILPKLYADHLPVLFLRAGHHNQDPGAVANGVTEHSLTTALRNRLHPLLLEQGWTVDVDDDSAPLAQDVAYIRRHARAEDLLLDIHFNAGPAGASGTECFVKQHPTEAATTLAQSLAAETAQLLGIPNRHLSNGGQPKTEAQTAHGRLAVMRLPCQVILWEVCFLTNPHDLAQYQTHQVQLAQAIATRISQSLVAHCKQQRRHPHTP